MPRDDARHAQGLSAAGPAAATPAAPPGPALRVGGAEVRLEHVAETGSTQSDLAARYSGPAAQPLDRPVLRLAARQTQGRGRLGRRWEGDAGAALTFTLALRLARPDLSGLSLAIGVALADALAEPAPAGAPRLRVKWPNDLVLLDDGAAPGGWRKLAGILVETSGGRDGRVVLVGIGLNVRPQAAPADGGWATACWAELYPPADVASAFGRVGPALMQALDAFERHGFDTATRDRYAARDALRGLWLRAGADEGRGDGLAEGGGLRLVRADGRVATVTSGEVSVRPHAGPTGLQTAARSGGSR